MTLDVYGGRKTTIQQLICPISAAKLHAAVMLLLYIQSNKEKLLPVTLFYISVAKEAYAKVEAQKKEDEG